MEEEFAGKFQVVMIVNTLVSKSLVRVEVSLNLLKVVDIESCVNISSLLV